MKISIPAAIEKVPKQPLLCIGCVWGTWEGTKQYCLRINCVKAVNDQESNLTQ